MTMGFPAGVTAVKGSELTPEQMRLLAEAAAEREVEEVDEEPEAPPAKEADAVPAWCKLPSPFSPPPGRQVLFIRFLAKWTEVPSLGDRTCVLWPLTEADEKLAMKRTRGDAMRTLDEMTKQCIRVVDGHPADWTGHEGPGSVSRFWRDIGAKCRQRLREQYIATHTMNTEESVAFFESCIAVRTAAG